jgi:3-dehydroquinate synthase class II
MMKQLWIDIRPWRKKLATAAIESGADAVVVKPEGHQELESLPVFPEVMERQGKALEAGPDGM